MLAVFMDSCKLRHECCVMSNKARDNFLVFAIISSCYNDFVTQDSKLSRNIS